MFEISSNAPILTTPEYAEHENLRMPGELITSSQAKTIASWWQSPNGTGSELASFASGCAVDNEELLADIDETLSEARENMANHGSIDELEELRLWVESFSLD